MAKKRPDKITDLLGKVTECIEKGNYFVTTHAFVRQSQRMISLLESLHVLTTGYEEKKKTSFDVGHNT